MPGKSQQPIIVYYHLIMLHTLRNVEFLIFQSFDDIIAKRLSDMYYIGNVYIKQNPKFA